MAPITNFLIAALLFYGTGEAYKAAVVEFHPQTDANPHDVILKNLNFYRELADSARVQAADILVFPEYGLTQFVTDPRAYATEIRESDDVIKELIAIALERQMYIVVNLLERVQEGTKPTLFYNTDLVFDRAGNIIAKYRKINLVNEPNLTPGTSDQNLTFTTDFGVTFGLFTGSDIFYNNPSRSLLRVESVTDVIFPTSFVSSMPFQIATSIEHGYSVSQRVNMLAANYGNPQQGRGGSGIYLSDGTAPEIYIDGSPSSKLIVAEIKKHNRKPERRSCASNTPFGLPGKSDTSNIQNYNTTNMLASSNLKYKSISLTDKDVSSEICYDNFCCTFNISVDSNQPIHETYKLVALNGPVALGDQQIHVKICSLLLCENESTESCGIRTKATTKFRKITVDAQLPANNGTVYSPITLNSHLKPLVSAVFCNTDNSTGSIYAILTTFETQEDVLVFGLFGLSGNAPTRVFGLFITLVIAISGIILY